jgi:alkylation response protein AidB-like acyl-CoA dehydrogenase
MHHFTVAMLFSLARTAQRLTPAQLKLLSGVAGDGLLLASGWAEGRTDQNILAPAVIAQQVDGRYLVNGAKQPCSLSRSMDLLTASVMIPEPGGRSSLAVLLIPADSPGITIGPFWSTPILAVAQSDRVVFTDVEVPEELVIRSTPDDQDRLDDLQTAGFTWFERLVTSAYTGAASTLVQVLGTGRGTASDRGRLGTRLAAAIDLVEGGARAIEDGLIGDEAVAATLIARYTVQDLLSNIVDTAAELLGGMGFIRWFDVAHLASTVRALAFHPPSRGSVAAAPSNTWRASRCGCPDPEAERVRRHGPEESLRITGDLPLTPRRVPGRLCTVDHSDPHAPRRHPMDRVYRNVHLHRPHRLHPGCNCVPAQPGRTDL